MTDTYGPGCPPQKTIYALTADQLLAVRYDTPAPSHKARPCAPGAGFDPVGYRVGRCLACGQVAPIQTRGGQDLMVSHPRAEPDSQEPQQLPVPVQHPVPTPPHTAESGRYPNCGSPGGRQRHRKEGTPLCGPCTWFKRGYSAGYKAGMAKGTRIAGTAIPAEQAREVVEFCRAFVLRRPVPVLRPLAIRVVQRADAELCATGVG